MSDPALFPVAPAGADALRRRLDEPEVLIAPGAYDGLSARLLEASGHEALFLSGFSMAAARLGLPDVGLMGYAESLDQTRSIRGATSLPIIADADTDRIVGAHVIGPRAGAVIAELALAVEFSASAEDVARSVHAHPTLAEVVKEAALDAGGRVIHM